MTAISLSSTETVSVINPHNAEILAFPAGTTITAGQVVYFNTSTGKLALADADSAGTAQVRGVALRDASANQECPILIRGLLAGYVLTSLSYDDRAYLSGTAGGLDTAAGSVSVVVGRVVYRSSLQGKCLYVDTNWGTQYA